MKKVLSIVTIMVVALLMLTCSVTADNEINVYLDGTQIEFDVYPQIINGRTMVPIRAIFEQMGAIVNWDTQTRTAICTKGNTVVRMTVDSMDMYINNQLSPMDIAPCIVDGRTLAPARYVAEAFGADVQWDSQNNAVIISSKKVTMYAADGRTISVFKSEVPAYKNVGWYETKTEAANANKPVNKPSTSGSASSTTVTGQGAASNNPTADGYYYRTPTGKKYHLDPNCGGKNSYRTDDISGLGPCSKCAK